MAAWFADLREGGLIVHELNEPRKLRGIQSHTRDSS